MLRTVSLSFSFSPEAGAFFFAASEPPAPLHSVRLSPQSTPQSTP